MEQEERLNQNLIQLLHKSFLAPYLKLDITDISFNGQSLYLVDNVKGRVKVENLTISIDQVLDLTRQFANVLGKNFNYTHPILEVAFDKYRLSAVYSSIAKCKKGSLITFSLRIHHETLRITKDDESLCPSYVHALLKNFIDSKLSIIISGKTGSGKTELQKYLTSLIHKEDKIILIEDSYESCLKELLPDHDITTWVILPPITTSDLVKVALRNQPDWLLVAETRGDEVLEMIESVSTGHPLITTLHSNNACLIFERIYNMGRKHLTLSMDEFEKMLASYFKIGIHMEAIIRDNGIQRRIGQIVEFQYQDHRLSMNVLYQILGNQVMLNDMSSTFARLLHINEKWYE